MTPPSDAQEYNATLSNTCRLPRQIISTYRLQLMPGFGFAEAAAIVDYLRRLGISELYTSPYLQAHPGSTHGYDVINHGTLNEELGGEAGFRRMADTLRKHDMGHIVDMVPNHMDISGGGNAWWQDVLENGEAACYAPYFDIDWHPRRMGLRGKVLLPILGDMYGYVLERGELQLGRQGGGFFVDYYDNHLPLAPESTLPLLNRAVDILVTRDALPPDDPDLMELQSIMTSLKHLPGRDQSQTEAIEERGREKEVVKRRLETLCGQSPAVEKALDEAVAECRGTAGDPRSFDLLDSLLNEQSYRLSFWKVATEEINYRRFFDVNTLAALRMEDERAFRATHTLILDLVAQGLITGLRLDHIDGLYEPLRYLQKLQAERCRQILGDAFDALQAAFAERMRRERVPRLPRPLYVVVEKILEPGEHLPTRWPIYGTTGYDFLNAIGGLWVDPRAERSMTATYKRFTGKTEAFAEVIYRSKKQIMRGSLASETGVLVYTLKRIAESNRRSQDFTANGLSAAIIETIACFPVYRSYLDEDGSREEHDDEHIEQAIEAAKQRNPNMSPRLFDFLRDTLLLRFPEDATSAQRAEQIAFALKFQQVSSPVMAKGVEDTAFYVYNRLISLNEVGGDPACFGVSPEGFHAQNQERLRNWPLGMTTTATHDTKRGEDVRTRLGILSEMPAEWRTLVNQWSRLNRAKKSILHGEPNPDRNMEYFYYQTLFGAWPLENITEDPEAYQNFTQRIEAYLLKAAREAKQKTGWINPNEAYELALTRFVQNTLKNPRSRFVQQLQNTVGRYASYGACNSLAQVLLRVSSPGVPDTYQGCELWDFHLVDPDNRGMVDFNLRRRLLQNIEAGLDDRLALARALLQDYRSGAVKLYTLFTALHYRTTHPRLFLEGDYRPLFGNEHVIAFARRWHDRHLLVAVPRFPLKLTGGILEWPLGDAWGNTAIEGVPGARYRNLFTDESICSTGERKYSLPLKDVFRHFPIALLVPQADPA